MSPLRQHIQELRTLVLGTPGVSRLPDITLVNVLDEMAAALEELDAGMRLHADALQVVARQFARHMREDHPRP